MNIVLSYVAIELQQTSDELKEKKQWLNDAVAYTE